MSSETKPPEARGPKASARVLVGAVLAVQVVVPATLLFAENKPVAFGWQMYAATKNHPRVDVVRSDGTVSEFDSAEFDLVRREITIDVDLLRNACGTDPDIAEFLIHDEDPPRVYECSR